MERGGGGRRRWRCSTGGAAIPAAAPPHQRVLRREHPHPRAQPPGPQRGRQHPQQRRRRCGLPRRPQQWRRRWAAEQQHLGPGPRCPARGPAWLRRWRGPSLRCQGDFILGHAAPRLCQPLSAKFAALVKGAPVTAASSHHHMHRRGVQPARCTHRHRGSRPCDRQ